MDFFQRVGNGAGDSTHSSRLVGNYSILGNAKVVNRDQTRQRGAVNCRYLMGRGIP